MIDALQEQGYTTVPVVPLLLEVTPKATSINMDH